MYRHDVLASFAEKRPSYATKKKKEKKKRKEREREGERKSVHKWDEGKKDQVPLHVFNGSMKLRSARIREGDTLKRRRRL